MILSFGLGAVILTPRELLVFDAQTSHSGTVLPPLDVAARSPQLRHICSLTRSILPPSQRKESCQDK